MSPSTDHPSLSFNDHINVKGVWTEGITHWINCEALWFVISGYINKVDLIWFKAGWIVRLRWVWWHISGEFRCQTLRLLTDHIKTCFCPHHIQILVSMAEAPRLPFSVSNWDLKARSQCMWPSTKTSTSSPFGTFWLWKVLHLMLMRTALHCCYIKHQKVPYEVKFRHKTWVRFGSIPTSEWGREGLW